MRFGVILPNQPPYTSPDTLSETAEAVEEIGLDILLVWDHYHLPWSDETTEAWITLSYLAAKTEKIKLGTCVTPIPFRNPLHLAKMISSLDILSGGRVVLGVGAGWHKPEFDMYSQWYLTKERVERTIEGVRLLKKLWTETPANFEGKYYQARNVILEPKPIQSLIPTWWGTTGRRMLRAASRLGEGWIPTQLTPAEYRKLRETLENLLTGEKKKRFVYAYADYTSYETADRYIEQIEKYEEAGCNLYAATWHRNPNKLKRIWSDIIESF